MSLSQKVPNILFSSILNVMWKMGDCPTHQRGLLDCLLLTRNLYLGQKALLDLSISRKTAQWVSLV